MIFISYLFSTTFKKEEVKIASHVKSVLRYTWYGFESRSYIQAQMSL